MYRKRLRTSTSLNYTLFIGGIIVVAIALALVLYFSSAKAIITVHPSVTKVATDFSTDIVTDGATDSALEGVLYETELTGDKTAPATGEEILADGTDVIGTVTLINNHTSDQPLVATTRLLTSDGILLRMKTKQHVPAGGTAEVQVYADDPTSFTEIPATMFTIPGLWEGLQDKIYAESKNVIKNTPQTVKAVTDADISNAKEALLKELENSAIEEFSTNLPATKQFSITVVKADKSEETVSAEVGDQLADFKTTMKVKLVLIAVAKDDLVTKASSAVELPEDRKLVGIDLDNLSMDLVEYNTETKTASVKVQAQAKTTITDEHDVLDKSKLVNLSEKGVQLYLASFEEVDSAEVYFSPFWVEKTPKRVSKIIIKVD